MHKENILYWLPRVLALTMIGFLAIFAFDVETISGFLIHLMPNYLLAMALIVAWKKENIGGFLFIILGLFFTVFFETYHVFGSFLLISFPAFLIGILFLTDYIFHARKKKEYEFFL